MKEPSGLEAGTQRTWSWGAGALSEVEHPAGQREPEDRLRGAVGGAAGRNNSLL